MRECDFDVVGIGNAIVDIVAQADDRFVESWGLVKGSMTLIDAESADRLYGEMGPAIEVSGGSAANTIAALASLGARTAFIGKVRDDQLGVIFRHDVRSLGVHFGTAPARDGAPTGRCLILVTPDAQRTMQTYLGASAELVVDDIDDGLIARTHITYLEGYLWDRPHAKEAFIRAANLAHATGRRVALSLSDAFCVERHRGDFRRLVEEHVDVLFANEDEIVSLYQQHSFDAALQAAAADCDIAALTRGEKGSVIVAGSTIHVVDAAEVAHVVDTTGAGDGFAAGFLYGMIRGLGIEDCARVGGVVAAEIIGHFGARAECSLLRLVETKLTDIDF